MNISDREKITISPSKASGVMKAPPSKSMAHRLLICAGLGRGESVIKGVDSSEDVLATLDCLRALGAEFTYENKTVRIRGINISDIPSGAVLPCRECGSTLRFFIPICLLTDGRKVLRGSEKLFSRGLGVYEKICRDQKILYRGEKSDLTLQGRLSPGEFTVEGNISSQFISGLLFALPLLEGDSRINILPPAQSRPYISMTMEALESFGVRTLWEDETHIFIPGNQSYEPRNLEVEGDYSNAAFFEALNVAGGNVEINGLRPDSLQGDRIYKTYFEALKKGPADLDISDCPDLGPILFAVASMLKGGRFTGTKRLKIKESDRGEAMRQELLKLGIEITVEDDTIIVPEGQLRRPDSIIDGHNDHRIVMALSVILTLTGGEIRGTGAVKKSLPDFFERLQRLGIEIK